MYTSLKPQMFRIIDSTLQRFPLVYVDSWTPSAFSRTDQLLMTLMKLKLNCPFLDLAERFCTSRATIHNIIITHVFALHEVFFKVWWKITFLRFLSARLQCQQVLEILTVVALWLTPLRLHRMFPVRTWQPSHRPTVPTKIDILWSLLLVLLLMEPLCT